MRRIVKIFLAVLCLIYPGCPVQCDADVLEYMKCPMGCVCQFAHFMDLPISRWINYMQLRKSDRFAKGIHSFDVTKDELVNDNEATYEADQSFMNNPFIKQATCILQFTTNIQNLIKQLPADLEALVLLYTSEGKNKTVPTSVFKSLDELTVLEIRGPQDRNFRLIIDEPMANLQHVNFESITLIGSENYKRPKNPIHPRESFDYVPSSEQVAYNLSLDSPPDDEDIEILPYEVYIMEIKKSRMATFYGWDQLEVLRIHHCKLDELHWEMFDGLLKLQHLSLEHNEIKIVPAFALYGAMHIRTLSLAHNFILDLNYRSLAGLLELKYLDLGNNNLTKLSELSFPPFPKLEYINFRNNPIRYIFPASFGVMNHTQVMHLGSEDTAAELWGNIPFEFLTLLKVLTIENISVGALEQGVFKGLTSLEVLHLKGRIRSIDFDAFVDMSHLRELNLSSCNIREISMDAFIGCKRLDIIDLSNNNLSHIPPGLFDDQTRLREIYLQGNNLRYLPSTFFQSQALRLVRLTDNPWKCACNMITWKQKLTNQLRGPKTSRCLKDFQSGKLISCHVVENYKFEKSLSPRCENFNGHSVYYAIRKDLRCNFKREPVKRVKYYLPYSLQHVTKHRTPEDQKYNFNAKQPNISRWRHPKAYKLQKTKTHLNSLEYLTANAPRKNKTIEKSVTVEDDFVPNNI